MPLDRLYLSAESVWGTWSIQEDQPELASQVPEDAVPPGVVNPSKRLEFLAGRALIKALLAKWDQPYRGMWKDAFGKPFLTNSNIQISLSHSYPHVAGILHRSRKVGIDLEQPKEKLLRIAARVLSDDELADAGQDIIKHCIYWCAKEALVKIYGKKDLSFSTGLRITPFNRAPSGHLVGRILATHTETTIPLEYHVFDNYVIVVSNDPVSKPKDPVTMP